MMKKLAERRKAREEDAREQFRSGLQYNQHVVNGSYGRNHPPSVEEDYGGEEDDEEEYKSQEEEFDDEVPSCILCPPEPAELVEQKNKNSILFLQDAMTEEQRME